MSGILTVSTEKHTKIKEAYCHHGVNCFINGNEQALLKFRLEPQIFKRLGSKRAITLQDPQGEGRGLQIV